MLENICKFAKKNKKPVVLDGWSTVDGLIAKLRDILGNNVEVFNPFVDNLSENNQVKLIDGNYLYNFRDYGVQIGGANGIGSVADMYSHMMTSGRFTEEDAFNMYLISIYSLFGLPNTYYTDEFWSSFNIKGITVFDNEALNIIKQLYKEADFYINNRKSYVGKELNIDNMNTSRLICEVYLPSSADKGYEKECVQFSYDYDCDSYWLKSSILHIQLPYYITGIYFETLFKMLVSFINAITYNVDFTYASDYGVKKSSSF